MRHPINDIRKSLNPNRGARMLVAGTSYEIQLRDCTIAHSTSVCQGQCLLSGPPPLGEAMRQGEKERGLSRDRVSAVAQEAV